MKKAAIAPPRIANIVTAAVAPGVDSEFCCRRCTSEVHVGEKLEDGDAGLVVVFKPWTTPTRTMSSKTSILPENRRVGPSSGRT